MTKIKTIKVENFKAVSNQEIDLNGASILVTAGNNKGKTSVLRGLIDRFRGEKPDIIVKEGEEKGVSIMELTDGSKIEWNFTEKKESFAFTTSDNFTKKTGVLKAIGQRFFGIKFDIDKFITSSQTEQTKQVQKLLGIDLSELDKKYKEAYDLRTSENKELNRIIALNTQQPEEVDVEDIEALKEEKKSIEKENEELKNQWKKDNENHQKEAVKFNDIQNKRKSRIDSFFADWEVLNQFQDNGCEIERFIDFEAIERFHAKMEKPEELKEVSTLKEPEYKSLEQIEEKIEKAYENKSKKDAYDEKLKLYNDWVESGKKQRKIVDDLNEKIEKIKKERFDLVQKSKLPEHFELTENGLTYKGLPLENAQISSSAKYICALKLGSLALGELRTMHFDASYLDKNSLQEIQDWAEKEDLQLMIERPDYDGGDITYKFI